MTIKTKGRHLILKQEKTMRTATIYCYQQTRAKPGAALQTAYKQSVSKPFPPTALRPRHAQTVRDSTSSYKIDYVKVIKNFLNLEGHKNPISGSKFIAIILKGCIWPNGGASSGSVCACSLRSRLVLLIYMLIIFDSSN